MLNPNSKDQALRLGRVFFLLFLPLVSLPILPSISRASSDTEKHAERTAEKNTEETIKIRELPSDFLIPAALWDQLLAHEVKPAVVQLPEEPGATTNSSVVFSGLKLILTEKNPGILKSPVLEFEFPKGGGEVDLSRWTTGTPGTFFVKFVFPSSSESPTFEAFHLSKTRKRRVDGRIFGGGCQSFYKITKVLKGQKDQRGFPVNTTRDFHISTLGGHFLFSWQDQEAMQVTQVKIISSEKPELFCQSEEGRTEAE